MATVLVTGGAGFIGSHTVDELVKNHEVIVLDDLSGGFAENVNQRATFVRGSILDYDLLSNLFERYRFEYVFHLAAYAAEGLSHFIKRFIYSNNLIGSINLINLSILYRIKCFVFTSSFAVYGALQVPMREELTPEPEDSYGISKYAIEMELAASKKMFGLDYIIFRPHNVYGERQNLGDKYRNVVGIFMNQIMKHKPLTVFGDGKQTRAFTYISDVAPVIARSISDPKAYNQVFNIGADRASTILELIRVITKEMGSAPEIRFLEERNEVKHTAGDHSKIGRFFGTSTPVPLEEGIHRMAVWARSCGPQENKAFETIEIPRKLPSAWT